MNTDKRKRSGISGARASRIAAELKKRLLDIIFQGIHFKQTHDFISQRIIAGVLDTPEWRKAPGYVCSYLQGVSDTKRDEIYHYHLAWLLSVDGSLLTSKQVNALTRMEKEYGQSLPDGSRIYSTDPGYKSPWSRVDSSLSRHVWKDANGNPLADKPYDAKFLEKTP